MTAVRALVLLCVWPFLGACALRVPPPLDSAPEALVVTSGGPNRSASFLVRVDSGIVVIDLGWWGAERALEDGLAKLGGSADEVVAVFLTHAHRDHIGAWRLVRQAPFHLAAAEMSLLFREEEYGGWIPRWAEKLKDSGSPAPDQVTARPFSRDTFFAFGADTIRAFLVPGHTSGSAAYLFRGVLFAGDAMAWTRIGGFGPARRGYSDDVEEAKRSLASLRERLAPYPVLWMCSAHLRCAEVSDELWADLAGPPGRTHLH